MVYRRKLPYDTHPLFSQRQILIITSLIGAALCLLTINASGDLTYTVSLLFLFLSTFLAACDLNCYAMTKIKQPEEELRWPQVVTIVADLFLAIVLQLSVWASADAVEHLSPGSRVCAAHAALTDLLCSLLHAYCFWKQVEARWMTKWLAGLQKEPCKQCGHKPDEDVSVGPDQRSPATRGRPSGERASPTQDQNSRMEEGNLIDSDLGSAYEHVENTE